MFKDLVIKNRSYRGFDESCKISRETMAELIDCARLTPSTANMQPLKYFLAYEEETVKKIQPLTKWAGYLPEAKLPHEGMRPTGFIVVCQDLNIAENTAAYMRDVGIVAQTILLAAAEKGLGGCMIGSFDKEKIGELLPEKKVPLLVIALGKPKENVKIVDIGEDGDIKYYRDGDDNHYVPKRKLEDLIL